MRPPRLTYGRPPGGRGWRRSKWRRSTWGSIFVALVLVGVALVVERLVPPLTGAVRVADGDSLVVDGERVRLDGIDAPELHQSCGAPGKEWPCGARAKAALEAVVAQGAVTCRPVDEDRYGRAVAICGVGADDLGADDRGGDDLAGLQVAAGWALATGLAYRREQAAARAAGRGIWSGPFEEPAQWRERHPRPPS
ncbi:thermonuclease family protein [Ancylobacter sp. WKF20]|uniref:thermonuclease family protein n=1 Tax=Ancylobacter sp. WKF20 TaxID=3039801 RepID=UPI00243446C9|nr:thermonuclease family protein [Ancylobacter sp. WKF20]WGD30558.1 thermonuclease family protein [Ancylobacter sp. WKF20]